MPAKLVMLSMFGWAAGIVPAIIDGTISVNRVMHNTMWVPGHFHFYLLLGVLPMVLAFMFYLIEDRTGARSASGRFGFPLYVAGGLAFAFAFLAGGHVSEPRRFAVHLPEWFPYDRAGSIGAILVIVAMLLFTARIIAGLTRRPLGHAAFAHAAS
jgi:cytochrome c oxidase subunit I